jgi:hypothetical protein
MRRDRQPQRSALIRRGESDPSVTLDCEQVADTSRFLPRLPRAATTWGGRHRIHQPLTSGHAQDCRSSRRNSCRSLGSRHGRRASREIAVGIIGLSVCHKLSNKMVRVGSQKPLRIPGNRLPPADRHPAIDERDGMDPCVGNQYALRYHRNAIARCCQRNERLRSGTFEGDVRSDTRRLAGRVEPFPRGKGSSE